MPDPHRIERELCDVRSRPLYSSLFFHRNQFRDTKDPPDAPQTLATKTTAWIMHNTPFHDPVMWKKCPAADRSITALMTAACAETARDTRSLLVRTLGVGIRLGGHRKMGGQTARRHADGLCCARPTSSIPSGT